MKRLLPLLVMALLVGACGGATPATETPATESPVAEVTPTPVPTPLAAIICADEAPEISNLLPTTLPTNDRIDIQVLIGNCSMPGSPEDGQSTDRYPKLAALLPTLGKSWSDVRLGSALSDGGFGSITVDVLRVNGLAAGDLLAWWSDEVGTDYPGLAEAPEAIVGEAVVRELDGNYLWVIGDAVYWGDTPLYTE
jgi:hypothetical protein